MIVSNGEYPKSISEFLTANNQNVSMTVSNALKRDALQRLHKSIFGCKDVAMFHGAQKVR